MTIYNGFVQEFVQQPDLSMPKLSKQAKNVAPVATSLPSKIPYIYPYRLPTGEVRYRIRIRKKTFAGKPLLQPINEIYHSLDEAKKRLHDLEFGDVLAKSEEMAKLISEGGSITFKELADEYYKKHLKSKSNQRDYKSRINVICNTPVETEDTRVTKFANYTFTINNLTQAEPLKFGEFRVKNIDINIIHRYIDARLKVVKPQTCANDIFIISNMMKDGHNLFTQLEKIEEPLLGLNWKLLEPQVEYRDKKLRPQHRQFIEEILIKKSRVHHYHRFFLFLYHTGARISEALSVKISDIDFDRRIIFMITKKNRRPRYVGMNHSLYPAVKEQADGRNGNEFLFPYSKETYQTKLKGMKKYLDTQGIKFTWHDLRHNYISSHLTSKNVLQIMHELDINDMQYFQSTYLNVIQTEQTALKVAQAKQLTPQEVAGMVGHFQNLEQTQEYTHYSPTDIFPSPQPSVNELQEQIRKQAEQIQQLMQMMGKTT